MEYKRLCDMPYYKECAPVVEGMGLRLVSIRIEGGKNGKVSCVVTPQAGRALGVDECAKVHRVLLNRMEALLETDDIAMELSSPGIERNIRNAAEFELFTGFDVRLLIRAARDKQDEGKDKKTGERCIESVEMWVKGKIGKAQGEEAVVIAEGSKEITVPYSDIAKARLGMDITGAKGEKNV